MSDHAKRHDPGLAAVERVRGVRERDSRVGLQQALAITAERRVAADRARDRLASLAVFTVGNPRAFAQERALSSAVAAEHQAREAVVVTAENVAEEARGRWQRDRSRLRAVELLLEKRRAERAADRARREARELDEIAIQSFVRRTALQNRRVSDDRR